MATEHDSWNQMCEYACLLSTLYRPRLSIDGNQWCALHGENLQDGVARFGDSPELAYWDFDKAWCAKLPDKQKGATCFAGC